MTESYGYSADRLQLTSQTATKSGNTLMSMTYNYVASKDRSGGTGTTNVNTGQLMDITNSQIKDPSGATQSRNESYNYDQVARLKQASGFYPQLNYAYDRWGNRTAVSGGTSQTVTLQQSGGVTNNRIATVNGITYGYDAAGDVTGDGLYGYAYDAECRIVSVDSGSTATYSYDAANRRVKKVVIVGGTSYATYYVWEGSNVIAEYGNAPAGGGGARYYHPDRLSNRMITDASGVVKGSMDNLPFGEDGGAVGESEKHRFTSYERDNETGSDYAMNRQHSNSTGRFNRPDPLAGGIANPQSLNRYAYVTNDPVNAIDPLGLLLAYITTCTRTGYNDENGNPVWFEKCETSVIWLPDPVVTTPIGPIDIGGPSGPPRDPRTVKRDFYKQYQRKLNDCIKEVFGKDAKKIAQQTLNNSPRLDGTSFLGDSTC